MGLIRPIFFSPFGDAGGGELLRKAAAFDEGLLQADELLVEQVVGLMDEANQGVGHDGGVFVLDVGCVEF